MTATITQAATTVLSGDPGGSGIMAMIVHAGIVVQSIMACLFGLSLVSWGIIVAKILQLRRLNRESEAFAVLFMNCRDLRSIQKDVHRFPEGHLPHIFRTGYAELNRVRDLLGDKNPAHSDNTELLLENVGRAVQSGIIAKRKKLQHLLPFLATTGSTAPFIGLFGTVWGIMNSFHDIGLKGSANLAVVAPGISEALVATAMGLAAAIPAVVAFNFFSNRILLVEDDMLQFSSDFLNVLKTDLVCMALLEPASAVFSEKAGKPGARVISISKDCNQ
jgi:biopolymer transport protein TolQ